MLSLFVGMGGAQDRNFEIAKNLDVFNSVYRELDLYYVDTIAPEKTIQHGLNSMLGNLDPYTTYIPPSELEDFKFMATGEYGGIGSIISQTDDNKIIINEPYEGKPAAEAGLKAGDVILMIDDDSIAGFTVSQASERLKGRPNTPLTVTVLRPGEEEPLRVDLLRQRIEVNPVAYYTVLDNGVGYIALSNFTEGCASEVERVFKSLKSQHQITSLVLDLRGNPGGILEEAVKIVNLFVSKDELVVFTKGKVEAWDKSYRTGSDPIDTEIPLAVFVNSGSASASEIVAGALQDMDRATIVGERTFGKGLVQSTRPVAHGGQVKLTIAKYYIPSGRCIQALDYSHRNEDGSVQRMPDSLTSVFETAAGRLVRDGGGVAPDLKLKGDKTPSILLYLIADNMIFDFVTQWCIDRDTIASPLEFRFSDEDYAAFCAFLHEQEFTYDQQSEKILKDLEEVAEFEGYLEHASAEFAALRDKLRPNLDRALEIHREEITRLITREVLGRYYYQRGKEQRAIAEDPLLDDVVELLGDVARYRRLLTPTPYSPILTDK